MRRLLLLALLAQTPGCYAYAEASLDEIAPGAQVRLGLSPQAAARYREVVAADPRTLQGQVRAREPGILLLDVPSATRQVGFQVEQLHQTLRLEAPDVTYVETRRLDRPRTYAGIGVTAVAVGAIAWKALGGWTGADTRPPTGGSTADAHVIRPWFRIPLPFP